MYAVWAVAAYALALIVIASTAGGVWLTYRGRVPRDSPADGGGPTSAMDREEKEAALERIQAAVTDLLMGVTGSLNTMTGDSTKYARALDAHQESLERMVTIEDLRELEQRLLEQVKEVKSANDQHRQELDSANVRVQEQQKDLERLQIGRAHV